MLMNGMRGSCMYISLRSPYQFPHSRLSAHFPLNFTGLTGDYDDALILLAKESKCWRFRHSGPA